MKCVSTPSSATGGTGRSGVLSGGHGVPAGLSFLDRIGAGLAVPGLDPVARRFFERLAAHPDRLGVERQLTDVGRCVDPFRLSGSSVRRDAVTGGVVSAFSTADLPLGVILVRCGNRRSSRCPSCARLYQGDAYQRVLAGIVGGKDVPASVAGNPLVFVTLTAPSFGAVCHRPGKRARTCRHGRARFCSVVHDPGAEVAGSPLCPECYDYAGQVLFNALASRAWKALMDNLYHHLARAAGLSRAGVRKRVRIEYLRVAEYQARGAIHFHVVMRLDGPEGSGSPVPGWASGDLLCAAVRSAVAVTTVRVESAALGKRVFRFGTQHDAEVVDFAGSGFSPEHVAAYLAKYVTKGTEDVGGADVEIRHRSRIAELGRNAHVRALMYAAWDLGRVADLARMRTRAWCHTLGYRGRVVTASRGFSVTFKYLRAVRAAFMAAQRGVDTSGTVVESHFSYAGHGFGSPLLEEWAAELREDTEERHLLAQDALTDLPSADRGWAA